MWNRERKDDVMQGHEPRNEDNTHLGKCKEADSALEPPEGINPADPVFLAH